MNCSYFIIRVVLIVISFSSRKNFLEILQIVIEKQNSATLGDIKILLGRDCELDKVIRFLEDIGIFEET